MQPVNGHRHVMALQREFDFAGAQFVDVAHNMARYPQVRVLLEDNLPFGGYGVGGYGVGGYGDLGVDYVGLVETDAFVVEHADADRFTVYFTPARGDIPPRSGKVIYWV